MSRRSIGRPFFDEPAGVRPQQQHSNGFHNPFYIDDSRVVSKSRDGTEEALRSAGQGVPLRPALRSADTYRALIPETSPLLQGAGIERRFGSGVLEPAQILILPSAALYEEPPASPSHNGLGHLMDAGTTSDAAYSYAPAAEHAAMRWDHTPPPAQRQTLRQNRGSGYELDARRERYEEQFVEPMLRTLRDHRDSDAQFLAVSEQMNSLYAFFKDLWDDDQALISNLQQQLVDQEAQWRHVGEERDAAVAAAHEDQRRRLEAERGEAAAHAASAGPHSPPSTRPMISPGEQAMRARTSSFQISPQASPYPAADALSSRYSTPAATPTATPGRRAHLSTRRHNILFLPYHLHPDGGMRWFETLRDSVHSNRTTWLTITWVVLFLIAVGLCVGLLVPWGHFHDPNPPVMTSGLTVVSWTDDSLAVRLTVNQPGTLYYVVVPHQVIGGDATLQTGQPPAPPQPPPSPPTARRRRRALLGFGRGGNAGRSGTAWHAHDSSGSSSLWRWRPPGLSGRRQLQLLESGTSGLLGPGIVHPPDLSGRGRHLAAAAVDENAYENEGNAHFGIGIGDVVDVCNSQLNAYLEPVAAACGVVQLNNFTLSYMVSVNTTAFGSPECNTTYGPGLAAGPGGGWYFRGRCSRCPVVTPNVVSYTFIAVVIGEIASPLFFLQVPPPAGIPPGRSFPVAGR